MDAGPAWHRRGSPALGRLLLASLAACASGPKTPPTGTPEPDKFLYERGTTIAERPEVAHRRASTSASSWTCTRRARYRADAKLGIGDTYIGEGTAEAYLLGINEFREFLSYYPTHRRADYAQYKLGMATSTRCGRRNGIRPKRAKPSES